jgi:hypothetical protein
MFLIDCVIGLDGAGKRFNALDDLVECTFDSVVRFGHHAISF